MMLARVKTDYRWSIVQAFAGREYLKTEWREVPAGVLPQHPDLEFMEEETEAVEESEETEQTAVAEDKPKAGRPKK